MSLSKTWPARSVEFDTNKVTANIPEAQLVSRDFRCKVKVNRMVNKTRGKAYMVDSLTLDNQMSRTTILQQDTKKAWVAFETIHPSSERVEKAFDTRNKTDEDRTLFLIPFLMIIGVMGLMEVYLIKKTVIDKEPIILTRNDFIVLILASALVFTVMGFITYYLYRQNFHYSLLQSYSNESTQTYTFYLNGVLQSVSAVVYYGRFYVAENMPDSELFGFGPDEIEGGLTDTDGTFFYSKINNLRAIYVITLEEKSNLALEIREKKLQLADELRDLSDEQREEKNQEIERLDQNLEIESGRFDKELEDIKSQIDTLLKNYYTKLGELIGDQLDEKRAQEIINSNETISALRNQVSIKTVANIRLQKNIGAMYRESIQGATEFNERVYQTVADQSISNIQLQVQPYEQGNGKVHGSGGQAFDWNPLIQTTYKFAVLGGLVWLVFWIMGQLVVVLSAVSSTALIIGMIIFLIIVGILSRTVNKISAWTNAADSTVKVN